MESPVKFIPDDLRNYLSNLSCLLLYSLPVLVSSILAFVSLYNYILRMEARRKSQTFTLGDRPPSSLATTNNSATARNLKKEDLGGVVFGCKNNTMKECLSKQIFGLPSMHFSYVRKIEQGLPLFLFNYSDRKLHGVYEAAGPGQMNINPYGWTENGSDRTPYPAQVRICVRMQCQPLLEDQFSQILMDNYYSEYHFWFELDHAQTRALVKSFSSSPVSATAIRQHVPSVRTLFKAVPYHETKKEVDNRSAVLVEDLDWSDQPSMDVRSLGGSQPLGAYSGTGIEDEEESKVYLKLQEIALERQRSNCPPVISPASVSGPSVVNDVQMDIGGDSIGPSFSADKNVEITDDSSHRESVIDKLKREMEEVKNFCAEQLKKSSALEKKLVESETRSQHLNDRVKKLELKLGFSSGSFDERSEGSSDCQSMSELVDEVCSVADASILVVGGYNGVSWLADLDSYSPSQDVMRSLKPMSSVRSYASAAALSGNFYIFGGGNGSSWYDTVEQYNPMSNEWTSCPPLIERKGSLAGATLDNKIYAIGGGNGVECFWEVEMFDPALGRWVPTRSMLQKRFAPAATELNGVLYAVGGYDGRDYLKTAERFDPREVSWTRLPSMNTRRGCHSLAILDEKLYALGGYDGSEMVSSVEVFDPRMGSWLTGDPMNQPRGYAAAAFIGKSLYLIGGVYHGVKILDTVERYTPGNGWEVTNLKGIGKRCFFSAIVL
ncbi:hypothetical protein NE237_009042 [Protea cynaroides]|uniref:DCD domain-containing protein n=1 Tax=Protea cynaroides TaxID=273540 RepID=A0A9Q0KWQ7_9MAGN|nr:hypothetical protein NE237_009042 [Protea cynaroides]